MRHPSWLAILPLLPLFSPLVLAAPHAVRHCEACDTETPNSTIPWASSTIQWAPCSQNGSIPSEIKCGTLVVPLDHNNPPDPKDYSARNTVTLALSRLKAPGGGPREALFLNPGGPGEAATSLLVAQLQAEAAGLPRGVVSKAVREKYDLIALDPRGVGLSQPLRCENSLVASKPGLAPLRSESEWISLKEWNKKYAESCLAMSGDLVKFMDTVSVAKDHELVRQALGVDKFNMLSLSYGTQIAAQYIALYPGNVGKMVLDAPLDHTEDALHVSSTAAAAFEATLIQYFASCDVDQACRAKFETWSASYGNGQPFALANVFRFVRSNLEEGPVRAKACEADTATCLPQVTMRDFIFSVQGSLASRDPSPLFGSSWADLTAKLAAAANEGDYSAFAAPRVPMGGNDGGLAAAQSVFCADSDRILSFEAWQRQDRALKRLYPNIQGRSTVQTVLLGCVGWPFEPTNPPVSMDTHQTGRAADVLLLYSAWDANTSPVNAISLQLQLPSSRSVLRDGFGHTSYALGGDAASYADAYLTQDGYLPGVNTITTS